MGGKTPRDFAVLLDALLSSDVEDEHQDDEGSGRNASIPFDYLTVADELHSGRINVSPTAAEDGYREAAEALESVVVEPDSPADGEAAADALFAFSADPDAIMRELGLERVTRLEDFSRIRRAFALHNHPDRQPEHLRDLAQERMQVANQLIDQARQRFAGRR